MLHELRIENLLLIERAELRFCEGLNVITGETGAGKTVLAHSLDLLLGGKARPQIVRPGAPEAWVEGIFTIPPGVLDDPGLVELAARIPAGAEEVALGRRIGASGRTSAFIAGRSASASDLRALGSRLLAFYGQHEHRKLALGSAQLEILDGFAGRGQLERRSHYREKHTQVASIARELSELREREGARERDLDLLRFELAEIDALSPDPAEEAELAAARELLRHADALRTATAAACVAIAGHAEDGGGARAELAVAESALAAASGVDPGLDAIAARVAAAGLELGDLAGELRSYLDSVEVEPGRLEAVEERLDALERLKRKHGGTLEAVNAHAERCRDRIVWLEDAGELSARLERRLAQAESERAELAAGLTDARRVAATELERRVAEELAELAMEGARLEVALEPHPDRFGSAGAETVELRIATNPGMPVSPLRDAASGGELSRIMLALSGLAVDGEERALVFDEIDAGLGGSTARAVGERLRTLAAGRQVICITHLPQVASLASAHFRIEKRADGGDTRATVERIGGEELIAEIIRMLGAKRSDGAAEHHARELLAAA